MAARWNGNPILNQSFGWPTPQELASGTKNLRRTGGMASPQQTYGLMPERNPRGATGAQRIFKDPGLAGLGASPDDASALQQFRFANDQARLSAAAGDLDTARSFYSEALGLQGNGYVASQTGGELDFTAQIMNDAARGGGPALDQFRNQGQTAAQAQANQPSRTDLLVGNLPQTPIIDLLAPGASLFLPDTGPTANQAINTTAAVMRKTGVLSTPPQSGGEIVAQNAVDKAAAGLGSGFLSGLMGFLTANWKPIAAVGVAYVALKKL